MTNQEAFNKVWNHFIIENNPPSVDSTGHCLYRTEDGRKCAFGLFIPDELYVPEMEKKVAGTILKDFPALREALQIEDEIIGYLQQAHDKAAESSRILGSQFRDEMQINLCNVAKDLKLTLPGGI